MKEMLFALVILIIGFVLLIKGADFFVDGSSAVAHKFHIPSMIIGLTIVAMGTSLPECAVSVTASLAGDNSLAISNVIGSNIFNLIVVCGTCALFTPLKVQKSTMLHEFPFSIICGIALIICGSTGMIFGRVEGIVFLIVFACYLVWMIMEAKKAKDASEEEEVKVMPAWQCALYIIGGAIAIKYGGDFVVDGASTIAKGFGLSETLIGLTIVALGTSLPELVTSIVAAKKDEVDMALGNVIGSNIFNILLVLGIAGAISPVTFIPFNLIDGIILTIMSCAVWAFAWTGKNIERKEGIIMLLSYAAYMVYICIR